MSQQQLVITSLPADLLREHVFPFLGVRSIARCAKVCREWRLAVDSDAVWKPRCAALWKGHRNVPQCNAADEPESLLAFGIYTAEMNLSVKELKQILAQRMVLGTETFLYKSEFVNAMERSQPERFGDWQLSKTCKWKSSYLSSVLRLRQFPGISKAELVSSTWMMEYLYNHQLMQVQFSGDWTFSMGQQQQRGREEENDAGRRMPWKFLHSSGKAAAGDLEPFSHQRIQIAEYPPLTVTRDEDWGFVLTNEHVVMRQQQA